MLDRTTQVVTAINRAFLVAATALTVVLAIFMTVVVIRRYIFSAPLGWALDVARSMFAYIVFLAIAPTLQNGNHVSVELLYERLPPAAKHVASAIAWIMVIAFGALLTWKLYGQTLSAGRSGRLLQGSWQVPAVYIYAIGPVGSAQFVLTAVLGLARHLMRLSQVPVFDEPNHVIPDQSV